MFFFSIVFQQTNNMTHQIDPKAVGAHRPLSRRRSNPPGSPDSDDGSLFGSDSLSSLSSLLTNQLQQQNHSSLMMQLHRGHRKLDRSHSEPVVDRSQLIQGQQQQQPQSNSSRYKTELCRPYEENGTCKYGDKCQFAHGFHELRSLIRHPKYKTELCRTFHTIGFCPYGPRCHFVHNADEARNNSPPPPAVKSNSNMHRGKFTLPAGGMMGGNGSTADSPSPPSSLSESPTSMSTFFSDDMFPGNPFSPMATSSGLNSASAFLFGASNDYVSPLFSSGKTGSYSSAFNNNNNNNANQNNNNNVSQKRPTGKFIPELDSPSPVGSLASDLDSLSLGGSGSASPPPSISSPMDTSRALRLPIFSRISETLNED